jgi:hypothetical protein
MIMSPCDQPIQNVLFGLLIVFVLCSCGSETAVVSQSKSDDAWYLEPPDDGSKIELVDRATYAPVIPERIAEAEMFLSEIGTSQISPGEVMYFVGRKLDMPEVTRPFLIRGLSQTSNGHTIRIHGDALWVASDDEPGDTAPVRRQPLVLIMREVPELVYATTGK